MNYGDINGRTPLHIGVEEENIELVELLLSEGSNPLFSDTRGITPLRLAINQFKTSEQETSEQETSELETSELETGEEDLKMVDPNLKIVRAFLIHILHHGVESELSLQDVFNGWMDVVGK